MSVGIDLDRIEFSADHVSAELTIRFAMDHVLTKTL